MPKVDDVLEDGHPRINVVSDDGLITYRRNFMSREEAQGYIDETDFSLLKPYHWPAADRDHRIIYALSKDDAHNWIRSRQPAGHLVPREKVVLSSKGKK